MKHEAHVGLLNIHRYQASFKSARRLLWVCLKFVPRLFQCALCVLFRVNGVLVWY